VIGGAVGNMWDRLHYGAVVDFLDFSIAGYHWPAFNIADSAIFIGVVLLTFSSMFMESPRTPPQN
jgi:signal peptidase II